MIDTALLTVKKCSKVLSSPKESIRNSNNKGNTKRTQIQTIFEYLQEHVATASMVTAATGIPQKNITRYKRDLEKKGRLWEVEKKLCTKTGFKAWYITTNPNNKPFK